MRRTNTVFIKTVAIILSMITVAISTVMLFAVIFMVNSNFFIEPLGQVRENYLTKKLQEKIFEVANNYHNDESFDIDVFLGYTNYCVTIYDEFGNELASNYEGQDYLVRCVRVLKASEVTNSNDPFLDSIEYKLVGYISADMKYEDSIYAANRLITVSYNNKYLVAVICLVFTVLSVLILVYLMTVAGARDEKGQLRLTLFDRIPADIIVAFYILLAYIEVRYVFGARNIPLIVAVALLNYLLVLFFLISVVVRSRLGTVIKNNVIVYMLKLLWRAAVTVWNGACYVFKNISLVYRSILLMVALLIGGIMIILLRPSIGLIVFVAVWLLLTAAVAVFSLNLEKIRAAINRMSGGSLGQKIDMHLMFGASRRTAEALNDIDNGLSAALDKRIRNERFKAELITNVSHDLKTPLTSIVSYIDLLKREDIGNERAREYIEILERQSAKLKKLTTDLVEASKAQSGILEVHAIPCGLYELISQTAGEYREKLSSVSLELITSHADDEVYILADGRHLWRIFDNLLSNIYKYAQPGTRVYLNLETDDNDVRIIFRNTSKYELNISEDELTERFIRGDKSRHSEGHGLGLSIAKSLTELQGGTFRLAIDGDLFKVILTFKRLN
ncbi:MAG: HAMP domain-containing histidine kinase [Clostridia bacterium]|nr:HAMP domain-containing histidine kinase [Clostridia bacterium]